MKRILIPFGKESELPLEIKELIDDSENGSVPALMMMGDLIENNC